LGKPTTAGGGRVPQRVLFCGQGLLYPPSDALRTLRWRLTACSPLNLFLVTLGCLTQAGASHTIRFPVSRTFPPPNFFFFLLLYERPVLLFYRLLTTRRPLHNCPFLQVLCFPPSPSVPTHDEPLCVLSPFDTTPFFFLRGALLFRSSPMKIPPRRATPFLTSLNFGDA